MDSIKYSYVITEQDLVAFFKRTLLTKRKVRAGLSILIFLALLFIAFVALTVMYPNSGYMIFAILLFSAVFMMFFIPIVTIRMVRKNYRNNPSYRKSNTYTLTQNVIKVETPKNSISYSWDDVRSVAESKNLYFLFVSDKEAVFVPKEVLSRTGELETFKTYLRALPEASIKHLKGI